MKGKGLERKVSPQYRIRKTWSGGAEKIRAITAVFKNGKPDFDQFPPFVLQRLDAEHLKECTKILKRSHGGFLQANLIDGKLVYDDDHIRCYERLSLFSQQANNLELPESEGYTEGFEPTILTSEQLWDAIAVLMNSYDTVVAEHKKFAQSLRDNGLLGTPEHAPNDDPYFWPSDPNESNIARGLKTNGIDSCLTLQQVADLWGVNVIVVRSYLSEQKIRRWRNGFNRLEMIKKGIELGGFYCAFAVFPADSHHMVANQLSGMILNGEIFSVPLDKSIHQQIYLDSLELDNFPEAEFGEERFIPKGEIEKLIPQFHEVDQRKIRLILNMDEA